MNIKTKALKVEVSHVKPPENFNYEKDAFVVSDSDIGCYSRPETGNHILIGSEDPECDERIFVDPDKWDENFTDQWNTQLYRQAQRYPNLPLSSKVKGVVSLYMMCLMTGYRFMINLVCLAFIWLLVQVEISIKTLQ